jgi:molecular chaperone Hsp33
MAMSQNLVQSFQLQSSLIRGRIVRMGDVLQDILGPHEYPEDVLHLTGEVAVLTALLSSMLKFEGIFTLQTQSDGMVSMIVADITSAGGIRACAAFKDAIQTQSSPHNQQQSLMGNGYMAFTVDQGAHTERYQGIVELKPTLVESVQHYFAQSEQIKAGFLIFVSKVDGRWQGGGIMLQQMPEDSDLYNKEPSDIREDDWRRAMVLMSSMTQTEMLSSDLTADDLLYRLFHEDGVIVFEQKPLVKACRCSTERVQAILSGMSTQDLQDMTVDGNIIMTCEFCSQNFVFDTNTITGDRS